MLTSMQNVERVSSADALGHGIERIASRCGERAIRTRHAAFRAFIAIREISVIRHIVMWKLFEQAEGATRAENAQKLQQKLEACREIVPGILRLHVGIAQPGLESKRDVILDADFADKSALDAYQAHPTHEALKAFVGKIRESRHCVDFEV
jgi:Stress responsive A/B Barrel Domain